VDSKTELIGYDQGGSLAREHKPRIIVAGASAYPRIIDFARFGEIAAETGSLLLADIAHIAGLVAVGLHPDPVPFSDFVTLTNHKTLRGPRGGMILCKREYAKKVDSRVFPGIQGGPLMHVIAAKAVALKEAQQPRFKDYQDQILKNSRTLAGSLSSQGFRLVSGGTDNHLFLVDLRSRNISGKDAAEALERAGICCNRNLIPFDPSPPTRTSGLRLGTPAVTTRGMKGDEMKLIGEWISRVLDNPEDEKLLERIKEETRELTRAFPVYAGLAQDG